MFDPTIFDNLKVVFEGRLYDLESQGSFLVIGREDRIDLAGLSRTFLMRLQHPDGFCLAQLIMTSGLSDFAGELSGIRLVDEAPGALLRLTFELPGEQVIRAYDFHEQLSAVWGSAANITHKQTIMVDPHPQRKTSSEKSTYCIELTFLRKIDESHIDDVDSLLEHMLATIDLLES